MKTLVIGDSHLKIGILDDAKVYISQLLELIRANQYEMVILLGDQCDTFAVIRTEVLSLWTEFFQEASKHTTVVALVGNHDLSGVDKGTNPMEAYTHYKQVFVVDTWLQWSTGPGVFGNIQFLPFMRSKEEFEEKCGSLPRGSLLFCHQSFNGAQFENGFYDPHGADPKAVSHLKGVISGHVHKRQQVENIWYPGTPFQHTFSDAGEKKYIYELDLHTQGYTILKEIELNMPRFAVIERPTIEQLLETLNTTTDALDPSLKNYSIKFIASGSPSEIQAFWQDPRVKEYKTLSKRVVDGLKSIKPVGKLSLIQGSTPKEKLYGFIKSKQWRTDSERLLNCAEELLTS